MTKTYIVKESFRTVQGEGFHAGTASMFIRFASCNMWSGEEEDRVRDAVRNEAECPRWCDTDFRPGGAFKCTSDEVAALVRDHRVPHIVLTGGEPLLQVDQELLLALQDVAPDAVIAIETNGTVMPKFNLPDGPEYTDGKLWLTLSPKRSRVRTLLPWAHELKLVVPAYDPAEWEDYPSLHKFVAPQAYGEVRNTKLETKVANWVAYGDGKWRLSLQTHKIVGVQ